jgi:iron complex outermembrane receptor protein
VSAVTRLAYRLAYLPAILLLSPTLGWADAADMPRSGSEKKADATEGVTVLGTHEKERSVKLNDIVFTGSRLGLEVKDLPASVSVVTQERIQLIGARTALEAVEHAVGMIGSTGVGSIPSYATRGFSGNDITVMRDGIRQNTNSQSARPLDSFLFDRIEVLKGPASLLYGEGAIGGAVNYVSKKAPTTYTSDAIVTIGQWDTYRAGLGFGGPTGIENVYFRLDASHSESDGYVDRSGFEYNGFAGDVRWQIGELTSLSFSATYLKDSVLSYYGTPLIYDGVIDQNGVQSVRRASTATDTLVNARVAPGTRRLNYNNLDNFSRGENGFYRVILNTRFGEEWSLRNETYAATQRLYWRNTESTLWNPSSRLIDRSSFLLIYRNDLQLGNRTDLSWDHKIGGRDNKLVIGALYDNNDQDRNSGQTVPASPTPVNVPLTGFEPGFGPNVGFQKTINVETTNSALYVEDVFSPTDRWKLIGGLRYDDIDIVRTSFVGATKFEKSYSPWTGRLGTVFEVTPTANVYASYSRAAQPVSQLVSLVSTQADFSLQKGAQFEVGTKISLWDKADLTFALYDIKKEDLLTSDVVNGVRTQSQIGAQTSQGAELALSMTPASGWQIDANLAWTWKAEYEDFFENLGTTGNEVLSRTGNTTTGIPEWIADLFVVRDIGIWSLTAGVRYVAERWGNTNNSIKVDGYTTVEASVTANVNPVSITLRGRNLTDELYTTGSSALTPRFEDPRTAELTVKYAF